MKKNMGKGRIESITKDALKEEIIEMIDWEQKHLLIHLTELEGKQEICREQISRMSSLIERIRAIDVESEGENE